MSLFSFPHPLPSLVIVPTQERAPITTPEPHKGLFVQGRPGQPPRPGPHRGLEESLLPAPSPACPSRGPHVTPARRQACGCEGPGFRPRAFRRSETHLTLGAHGSPFGQVSLSVWGCCSGGGITSSRSRGNVSPSRLLSSSFSSSSSRASSAL